MPAIGAVGYWWPIERRSATDALFFIENVDIQLPPIELGFVGVQPRAAGW